MNEIKRWFPGRSDTMEERGKEGSLGRKILRLQGSSEKFKARLMLRPRLKTAQ